MLYKSGLFVERVFHKKKAARGKSLYISCPRNPILVEKHCFFEANVIDRDFASQET